ncbi:MAG: cation-translocating P-type ATPase, partial [Burkholderiales bacterium]
MQTELGMIAGLLQAEKDARTPLQMRLTRFGRIIAVAVLVLCSVMFGVGIMRGEPVLLMLLTAISLAVAAIPEALPAVVTVALALGARRMVQRNVLIRRLPAVETLGSVTYICSDKTGTLTENRMRVEEIYADGYLMKTASPTKRTGEPWESFYHALALSNDASRAGQSDLIGDPTEIALYRAAEQAGYRKETLAQAAPRTAELPFDSERARMTTLHRIRAAHSHPLFSPGRTRITPARSAARSDVKSLRDYPSSPPAGAGEGEAEYIIAYTKGAPEKLLSLCRHQLTARGTQAFDAGPVEEIVERMAADGLRVLVVAFRRWPAEPVRMDPGTVERDLTFLGLVGLMDPPRAEAAEAVALCVSAGITPVMITGDHPGTAGAIARRLHIIEQDEIVLTGQELARLSLEEFEEQVPRVRAYARVAPAQKIRIVQALQDRGEFVAMTGDGVNDAPALKRADIGIAMGKGGTDVAREASHMILLDDNFASIVAAVREGRRIFDNIRKFIKFIMTGNSGEILTLFLAPFLGLPIPLLPIHILWVNLVTDGLPGLALAVEPEERGVMRRPPRAPRESIFAHGMWQHIVWVGLLIAALCLLTQAWAIHAGNPHWQTMVFTVLTLAQMGHVLAVRAERDSLFTQGIFSNTPILGAVLLTFGLQLATIYVPLFNPIFRTQPLSPGELGFCLAASSVVFVAVEIEKALIRRGWLYNSAPNPREA